MYTHSTYLLLIFYIFFVCRMDKNESFITGFQTNGTRKWKSHETDTYIHKICCDFRRLKIRNGKQIYRNIIPSIPGDAGVAAGLSWCFFFF